MQHHRSIQRNHHAIQPVSPASYGSSMEVAPYNPVVTPTSSADFRGGIGETSYSLKTSAELLKVLNRIWTLEEQHASNLSLVRAMKKELDHARTRIKELVRDQQADRHEIDELMNQIAEDKLARKSKEQDRVSAAIQSVRVELEDERKLRKRSETLHRKLARELYEVKISLASACKDLERERKSRKMLEELCDEFAWGIKNYEQEMHAVKQKSEKDWSNRGDRDGLILHLSESWIDERMQMKQEPEIGLGEKNSAVDKLSLEIQNFLEAKQNGSYKGHGDAGPRGTTRRRNSLESIPLNVAASAPQDQGDDYGSSEGSDSHCFELDKPITIDLKPVGDEVEKSQIDAITKPNHAKKKPTSQDRTKARNPSSLQVKFEEQMARAISGNESNNQNEDMEELKAEEEHEIIEETEEGGFEGKQKANETGKLNSEYIDSLLRSRYLLSESGTMPPENNFGDSHGNSVWRSHPSPVRQWTTRLPTQDLDISESSSKLPPDVKENTLKAKLLEARTRGQSQRSRSRLKPSKVPF